MTYMIKKGIASIITTLIILVFIAAGLAGYVLFLRSKNSPAPDSGQNLENNSTSSSQDIQEPQPPPFELLGLWKVDKFSAFDIYNGKWNEEALLQNLYFEFKKDGTFCSEYSVVAGFKCSRYDEYSTEDGAVRIVTIGPNELQIRYKWKAENNKFELTLEMLRAGIWIQAGRYLVSSVSYESLKSAPLTDLTKPVVRSIDVEFQTNPETGKKEATISCKVTDDVAVGAAFVSILYEGDSTVRARTMTTKDTNPKDQVWRVGGLDGEKIGTHKATCTADDKAGNTSKRVEKTFVVK